MALNNLLFNGIQKQINLIQSITRTIVESPLDNMVGHFASLLNVLGSISRNKVVKHTINNFKRVKIPISQNDQPIESIKGIGKKLGIKLRSLGINTTEDLKLYDPQAFKISGISVNRIQKWKNIL